MYKLVSIISLLIRQYYLPNPFDALENGVVVELQGSSFLLTPNMLNWIAGLVLPGLTYAIVNLYYEAKSNPGKGSCLFLTFYVLHNFILHWMSKYEFSILSVMVIMMLYVGLHIILQTIKYKCF